MNLTDIQKQMLATFLSLRVGVGVIGIVFPLLLLFGGFAAGLPHQADSMSAYYHATPACIDVHLDVPGQCVADPLPTGEGLMRNYFVGFLFVIGACLYLLKGFSIWENILLTIAGILAVCVALFPMPWQHGDPTGFPTHYVSAITFFLFIAATVLFCSGKTLKFMPDIPNREQVIASYRMRYRTLAICMILSPLAAFVFSQIAGRKQFVFWAEAFGIWAFGAYWLFKTKELSLSDIERRALKGEIQMDTSKLQ